MEVNLKYWLVPAAECDRNEETYSGTDTDSYQMIEYGLKYVSSLQYIPPVVCHNSTQFVTHQKYFLQNKIFFSSWIELIIMKFPRELKGENIFSPQSGRWQQQEGRWTEEKFPLLGTGCYL